MTPSPAVPEAAPKGPPPASSRRLKRKARAPSFIEHLVVPGETLATIAKWYAGEATAWTEIAKHNPGMHPFRLKGGEIVQVPDRCHGAQRTAGLFHGPRNSLQTDQESA